MFRQGQDAFLANKLLSSDLLNEHRAKRKRHTKETLIKEPEPEAATQPKPAKKGKSAAKAGGGDAAIARKKKKEPELV